MNAPGRPSMKKLLHEPLAHFLGLGLLLFAVWGVAGGSADAGSNRIVVTPGHIERFVAAFRMTWQRPPTREEMAGLIEDFLKEEIYYREALILGFDRDDQIIRRRLRQKMEFLSEDVAEAVKPTRSELQAFLDENPDLFREEPRVSFSHAYFSLDRRGVAAEADAGAVLERIASSGGEADPMTLGDPFVLPHRFDDLTITEVLGYFGTDFAAALDQLEVGTWQGPISSGYGLHLVILHDRTPRRLPTLEEVEPIVERELLSRRRQETNDAVFRALRERYTVTVEWPEGMEPVELEGVGSGGGS
jgi:hypothetical protein